MSLKWLFLLLSLTSLLSCKRNVNTKKETATTTCLNTKEKLILKKINDYRLEHGLAEIPLSASLTHVAQTHAHDLSFNRPAYENCNMHSWSDKGEWKSCCYEKNHKQTECMWNKPKELTQYPGLGYEICFGYAQFEVYNGDTISSQTAFDSWKLSPGHHDVIINKKEWRKAKWNAIGIGIVRDFVCVWFGEEADPEITPTDCQ